MGAVRGGFEKKFKLLAQKGRTGVSGHSCNVPVRVGYAWDKILPDRICGHRNNGNVRGGDPYPPRPTARSDDDDFRLSADNCDGGIGAGVHEGAWFDGVPIDDEVVPLCIAALMQFRKECSPFRRAILRDGIVIV